MGDVTIEREAHVAIVEIHRPPDNYFDATLIRDIADAYHRLGAEDCRAIVLCAEGKHFCAGADFRPSNPTEPEPADLYQQAVRLWEADIPVVAAVQGAAIGGGLGLALSADFRVACPEARFAANFARLGFHQGFGLTVTLPAVVGQQQALDLLYTGRRVKGDEAAAIGLCDRLVPQAEVRAAATALAHEIALSAPLAVRSIRRTMRGDLPDQIRAATAHERDEQDRLRHTRDWAEGIRATAERRPPDFHNR
jgi:enoyl-CoA hydratase/carnithine racemase